MGLLRNGRSTDCPACDYVLAVGEPLSLDQLIDSLDRSPPETPLMFDSGRSVALPLVHYYDKEVFVSERSSNHPFFVGEILRHLRKRSGWKSSGGAWPVWGGRTQGIDVDFIEKCMVVDVRDGLAETILVLGDWEGREPVCPACRFCGGWGPGQITVDELIEELGSLPPDLSVRVDSTTPTELRGFRDRETYLNITRHLEIPQVLAAWRPGGATTKPAGDLMSDLIDVVDTLVEYYKGCDIEISGYSPVWFDGRMVTGVRTQGARALLATSTERWVGR